MNYDFTTMQLWFFAGLAVWEIIWKGFALWRAARLEQKPWFVALLVLNTAGILPIVYLWATAHKSAPATT